MKLWNTAKTENREEKVECTGVKKGGKKNTWVGGVCCKRLARMFSVNLILFMMLCEQNRDEEQVVRISGVAAGDQTLHLDINNTHTLFDSLV